MKAIDEGSISKAAKALVSKGIHPYTPQVMQKLWDLHPQRCLPGVSTTPAFPFMTFSKEDVLTAALSFPKGSSAGHSGLRPAHLREALQCGTSAVEDDLLNGLTEFCNICASGSIPRDVSPVSVKRLCRRRPFMIAATCYHFAKEKIQQFAQSRLAKLSEDW